MRLVVYIYQGYRGGKKRSRKNARYIFQTTDDGSNIVRIWDGKLLKGKRARAVLEISVSESKDDVAELAATLVEVASAFEKHFLNLRLTSSEIVEMHIGSSKRAAKKVLSVALPGLFPEDPPGRKRPKKGV